MDDNTIIPSYFQAEMRGDVADSENLNNMTLRVGEVKEIIYPDNKLSNSKKWVEYTVEVVHKNDRGTASSTPYHGCIVSHLFGGAADVAHYTLRKDVKDQNKEKKGGVGIGSKVVLLCINGNRSNAVILGGVPDVERAPTETKDDGHHLFFEFNGIRATINKDGEFTLMYRGATANDGKLANGSEDSDDKASGTKLFLKKDGTVTVSTKEDKEFVTINHDNGKIQVTASDDVELKTTGGSGKGIKIGEASNKMLLAETYRDAEDSMLDSIKNALDAAKSAITALQAGVSGVGGVAVTAPFEVLIGLGTSAIDQFKAKKTTFLSEKNKND